MRFMSPQGSIDRTNSAESPSAGSEVLTEIDLRTEQVMLGLRLAEGMPPDSFDSTVLMSLADRGLIELPSHQRVQLTLSGRLLADAVVRELLPA